MDTPTPPTALALGDGHVLNLSDVIFSPIRAQGAGGQNVNKSSTAIHLRFDVSRSSLPAQWQQRLLRHAGHRATRDGTIVIKAQEFRSLALNREAALNRLLALIRETATPPKPRKPTRPSGASLRKRLETKRHQARVKSLRQLKASE